LHAQAQHTPASAGAENEAAAKNIRNDGNTERALEKFGWNRVITRIGECSEKITGFLELDFGGRLGLNCKRGERR
jgi:hypothetical protein